MSGRLALLGACLVIALSSVALADSFDCKKTETQPECFARLKCQPNEELQDCQKRLRAAAGNGGNAGNQNGNGGGTTDNGRGDNDRGDNDRGDNDRGDNGRGESSDRDRGERRRGGWREESGGRRRRGGGGGGHGAFEANKTFGLGLELGEPTGINGKVFVAPRGAIDFGVGEIYDTYYYGNGVHLYADYLWHPVLLGATPSFELPFYVGVGLRYWDFDYCVGRPEVCYSGSSVGVRVPLGIDFDFNNVPLDIFLQVVPVLDFVSGDYYARYPDREHFGIDASAGIRFWFK